MGSRAGAGRQRVVASEASVMYRFNYLLCWWVLSMQTMYKDAEGGKAWGRMGKGEDCPDGS